MKLHEVPNNSRIIQGDCLEKLKELDSNSVDSIVTDPPYGISFMSKKWDYDVPKVELWQECLRVLKPGGHILVACGTRTQHRMAVNIEDAGFEIRDLVAWIYGSGFPKSHNIGKSVDKLQGNERETTGSYKVPDIKGDAYGTMNEKQGGSYKNITVNKTKGTSEWEGWGTALKPAMELWTLARKPLSEKTIAENVLKWGTGGINIDESRVGTEKWTHKAGKTSPYGNPNIWDTKGNTPDIDREGNGRFPANLIHDGSDEVVREFPDTNKQAKCKSDNKSGWQSKYVGGSISNPAERKLYLDVNNGGSAARYFKKVPYTYQDREYDVNGFVKKCKPQAPSNYNDEGSASRFFYCAKASKSERNAGLEGFEEIKKGSNFGNNGARPHTKPDYKYEGTTRNNHPTVKPIKLMQYLVRLITPKGGTVLDPFMGSGSTGIACKKEGFEFIGIEKEKEYIKIAKARIKNTQKPDPILFGK